MLEIKNLSKQISGSTILQNVDLEIKDGEFVAIFGPNGCGKTTLLNIVAGIETDYRGEVNVNGKNPAAAKSGFVFQNFHESLFPWLTIQQNIELNSVNAGKWIEKLNLSPLKDRYSYQLSGGQKQLACIARAYAFEPDILLFDEPFSALDYSITLKMQEQVQALWMETRKTTLFVSHDPDEAVFLADRVIIMSARPGKIKEEIKINLPRERNEETRLSKQFFSLRNKVIEAFTK